MLCVQGSYFADLGCNQWSSELPFCALLLVCPFWPLTSDIFPQTDSEMWGCSEYLTWEKRHSKMPLQPRVTTLWERKGRQFSFGWTVPLKRDENSSLLGVIWSVGHRNGMAVYFVTIWTKQDFTPPLGLILKLKKKWKTLSAADEWLIMSSSSLLFCSAQFMTVTFWFGFILSGCTGCRADWNPTSFLFAVSFASSLQTKCLKKKSQRTEFISCLKWI